MIYNRGSKTCSKLGVQDLYLRQNLVAQNLPFLNLCLNYSVCCALRLHRLRAIYLNFHFFDNFLDTAIAAKRPGDPMTPPPGCAPDPHIYNPLMGVLGETHFSATGLVRNNWSRDMDPWKILPPVSPNVFSKIGGGSTSLPTILSLKPSAPRSFRNTGLNCQIKILARNFSCRI